MLNKFKAMYRAGRNGQPMPARADKTVGETAAGAAITIGLAFGIVFAIGAGAAASERLFPLNRGSVIDKRKADLGLALLQVVELDNAKDVTAEVK